ncbi:DNA-3-methyladenine glycosylase I [Mangrovibrevibacter kandeliae]|uniref:DNA-3-methyladenine glycosylase I n=1 Tax=Mangrovibrevibacter kandeliae TaxID=2968473 RepID=UPI002117B64A|nr:DNA-3-methyladenine glycosylase I [Aurantimonas sp. CSK15Z-1]MCQ8780814.1 DNA-3-methyladenine glycosylase I [Aurantimonas sp. CSK15Z-1]
MSETSESAGLIRGEDGQLRCRWHGGDAEYQRYHDEEWGRPVADERRLFEKLCLEGFQAGLSWITILRRRPAFREVFAGFDIERVAAFDAVDVERALADARIIRHRGKIEAVINNARRTIALQQEVGSLAGYLWSFEPPAEERPDRLTAEWLRANPVTPASTRLSKALRKRGFAFVGPTTVYAFMQSMGFVNDHVEGCACRAACEAERGLFQRPQVTAG